MTHLGNHQKATYKAGLGLVILVCLVLGFNSPALAEGGRSGECKDAQIRGYSQGGGQQMQYQASNGKNVEGVCIKSGSHMFGDGHSEILGNGEYENGCYQIEGVGSQTLTVTKLQDGRDCQDISHLDIYLNATQPTPTDEPEPTPTDIPDPEPTPTDCPDPTPTPENEPDCHDCDCHDCDPEDNHKDNSEGQVLGAATTTLADTGQKDVKMALVGSGLAFLQFISGLTLKRIKR